MEIQKHPFPDRLELHLTGRLDSYWAAHLSTEIEEVIREGHVHLALDFSRVEYMSSAGISVLLRYYNQLQSVNGSFYIRNPVPLVRSVMDLSGISSLMAVTSSDSSRPMASATSNEVIEKEFGNGRFEIYTLVDGQSTSCRAIGEVGPLSRAAYTEANSSTIRFSKNECGLGLGAFGADFHDCRDRFGEFQSVTGISLCLPTDGKCVPDYQIAQGSFVPEVQVLYGLSWKHSPTRFLDFTALERGGSVALSNLIDCSLEIMDVDTLGIVLFGETTGLVGAHLKRPPVADRFSNTLFGYPGIRNWLSFTSEPAFRGSMTVACGIISKNPYPTLSTMLHPITSNVMVTGHIHATAFSYRHLGIGVIPLRQSLDRIIESEKALGLLHLIRDVRGFSGQGESEFIRGALWITPIVGVET